ncbi:MAG: hypothetical protein VX969_01655, partial [Verrucomicrobiota bacterium]|nr:hypothetical protein [Verrucomicrobiota bacterium]
GSGSSAVIDSSSANAFSRPDGRAFSYVPEQAFGVCSFYGIRMMEEVGVPKILSGYLTKRVSFLGDLAWDPSSCGINPDGRVLYFLQFPGMEYMEKRSSDVVFGLVLPIADQAKLKDFILRKLDLKSQNPIWKVVERDSPGFLSVQHKSAHVSLGLDEHCLVMLTSWWSDQPDPAFLDKELEQVFVSGGGAEVFSSSFSSKLSGNDYDLALALNGSNFFGKFKKTPEEEELFNQFREFLSFDLVLKAKASSGEISLDGEYAYEKPVLDSDFGLRVASKLDAVRDGSNSAVLSRAFGEFVEIFLQRLDYQTTIDLLERIDLTKSTGFEGFDSDSIETGARVRGNSTGFFKMKVKSSQSGGDSLSLMIDLLVAALNPLGKTTANSSASIQD